MNTKERIKEAVKAGVKIRSIADKAELSYYRISSVVNPKSYKSETKFDRFEEARINEALDNIKNAI